MNFMLFYKQYHSSVELIDEILFLLLEHKIHIFLPPYNILYS